MDAELYDVAIIGGGPAGSVPRRTLVPNKEEMPTPAGVVS
jgi:pyruvate/2-oxoglutarate dehydrogenase complex dihydrolipoamide dehydrogenase (E3) component